MSSPTASDREVNRPIPPDAALEGVSVRYRIPRERLVSIKEYVIRRLKGQITFDEFWALNDALLGFRESDIAHRFDRIVDFAGVRDFIDAPLRTYSTGMVARLGFAIATDVQPDVLILDEVLSVGDEESQRRSAARIRELRANGDAILLVSHSLESIRALCHRVAWLDHGRVRAVGPPDEIVEQYRRASNP